MDHLVDTLAHAFHVGRSGIVMCRLRAVEVCRFRLFMVFSNSGLEAERIKCNVIRLPYDIGITLDLIPVSDRLDDDQCEYVLG